MHSGRPETRIVSGDHHIAARQHVGQTPDRAGEIGHEQDSTTPLVGCAQAITSRPPAGAGPGGMKMAPETAIGSPEGLVER